MNQTQLTKRQERAATEPLVIQRVEEGFRVYAATEPKTRYLVSGPSEALCCTCPDFQFHEGDPDWQCKHIVAVAPALAAPATAAFAPDPYETEERRAIQEEGSDPSATPRRRKAAVRATNGTSNGPAQMLLKRSVSPDGRIDSLSVEFSTPLDHLASTEIRTRAEEMIGLQSEIVSRFLQNGAPNNGHAPRTVQTPAAGTRTLQSVATGTSSSAVPARLVNVAGMDGKWGRRLFITVEVNGKTVRLFGKAEQLAAYVHAAGYHPPEPFGEGSALDISCLVVTKPSSDGRYTDIEKVLPVDSTPPRPQPVRRVGP